MTSTGSRARVPFRGHRSARAASAGPAFLLAASALLALRGVAASPDGWLERLLSPDPATWIVAAAEAARPDPAARQRHVAELVAVLRKGEAGPEAERKLVPVYQALAEMGRDSRPAVPLLARKLKPPAGQAPHDVATRTLMETLARIGATPETVASFLSQLDSPDPVVALRAAEALGLLGSPSPQAAHALLARLPALPDAFTKMTYARAVAALGPLGPGEVALVSACLRHTVPATRYAAAWIWQEALPGQALERRRLFDAIPKVLARAECTAGGRPIQLVVKSFTGELSEDDATVWVLDEVNPLFAGFGGQLATFSFLRTRPGVDSPCDVLAFTDRDGSLVVPLLADARPHGWEMAGFTYDVRARKVAASATGLGQVPETPEVEPVPGGFAFLEVPQPSDSGDCPTGLEKEGCGRFRGQQVRSYTEGLLPVAWEVVRAPGVGYRKQLNLARTFQKAPFRSLFESRDAFAHAFGLDAEHAFVETPFYGRLVLASGERWLCAAPARVRTADETRCRREGAGTP